MDVIIKRLGISDRTYHYYNEKKRKYTDIEMTNLLSTTVLNDEIKTWKIRNCPESV